MTRALRLLRRWRRAQTRAGRRPTVGAPSLMRCPTCYLPMRQQHNRDALACWLCGRVITRLQLVARSPRRRLLDHLTGLTDACGR